MKGRTPTITAVAEEAGVGRATAARALGGYGFVSDEARRAVLEAAQRLGYRANSLARTMSTGVSNTLGVVIADIENPYFTRAVRGITDAARQAGYEVIVCNTDEDVTAEAAAVAVLEGKRVDGLLVAPASPTDAAHLRAVADAGTPVVLFDRDVAGAGFDTVVTDDGATARAATRYLAGLGHRRIAFLSSTTGPAPDDGALPGGLPSAQEALVSSTGERLTGYLQALAAARVEADSALVRLGGYSRESAATVTAALLALPEPPTALLSTDSVLTLGVLDAVRAAGVAVPGELSLVGFDDPPWSSALTPSLTVVAQPAHDVGALAAQLLLARLGGDDGPVERHVLHNALVVRESVAALAAPEEGDRSIPSCDPVPRETGRR